jgi:DNA-binding NtrC family response regulator
VSGTAATQRSAPGSDSSTPGEPLHPDGPRKANGPERAATILVVEDEILIRLAVADFLRDGGYRVFEASNAAEALKVLASGEPIELVFSDITMPGAMDGLCLAAWIRQMRPAIHVILTSGVVSAVSAAQQSVATVVEKPYSYDTLAASIKRLIGR